MPLVLDWPGTDSREVLACAQRCLQAGRIVVFPSEVGYECAASALLSHPVGRLRDFVGVTEFLPIALSHVLEVFDWLPFLRGVGARLARRFWPGPLTLVSDAGSTWGLAKHLPAATCAC